MQKWKSCVQGICEFLGLNEFQIETAFAFTLSTLFLPAVMHRVV